MSTICKELHSALRHLAVHHFPFDASEIPLNGVYILYEVGEHGHGGQRVVRIGTHTGSAKLRSRLHEHFIKENKDRSIFRKNIGRALLNREDDAFLADWDLDLTSSKAKKEYAGKMDVAKKDAVERAVTDYIQGKFRFSVILVEDKGSRMELEKRLIATVSSCQGCRPSSEWLGLHSPKRKIRESGLWQEQHLYKRPMTAADLTIAIDLLRHS